MSLNHIYRYKFICYPKRKIFFSQRMETWHF